MAGELQLLQEELSYLMHFTTLEAANKIKRQGFSMKFAGKGQGMSKIDEGIYFYPKTEGDYRLLQSYAYSLAHKVKTDDFAIIYVTAPANVQIQSKKREYGILISPDNLSLVKVVDIKKIERTEIGNIY